MGRMVVSKDVTVANKQGLHARPSMQFVDLANGFQSDVMVAKGGDDPLEVDGKSVMGMIMLGAAQGTVLNVKAVGEDAEDAVSRLVELIASKFGEE